MEDISKQILNDIETDKVMKIAEDKVAFNAMKKYLLAVVYKHGVAQKGEDFNGRINFALNLAWGATQNGGMPRTDEELGQNLRALTYATQLIESGFREISELKKPEVVEPESINESE